MSRAVSIFSCTFQRLHVGSCRRFQASTPFLRRPNNSILVISKHKENSPFMRNQTLRLFGSGFKMQNDSNKKMDVAVYNGVLPGPAIPSNPSPAGSNWKVWILGMVVSLILPFWKNKWGPFLQLKNEVDTVVEMAEQIADIVEDVAEGVEKVADEIGDNLSKGRLKDALEFVENVAKEVAKDAELVGDVIDKVQEVEERVESILVEPIMDKVNETTKQGKDQ